MSYEEVKKMSEHVKDDGYSVLEIKIDDGVVEVRDSYSMDSIKMTFNCWDELADAVNQARSEL